jgi:hypothetical protein
MFINASCFAQDTLQNYRHHYLIEKELTSCKSASNQLNCIDSLIQVNLKDPDYSGKVDYYKTYFNRYKKLVLYYSCAGYISGLRGNLRQSLAYFDQMEIYLDTLSKNKRDERFIDLKYAAHYQKIEFCSKAYREDSVLFNRCNCMQFFPEIKDESLIVDTTSITKVKKSENNVQKKIEPSNSAKPEINSVNYPREVKYVRKPLVIHTPQNSKYPALINENLKIITEPKAELIASDHPERFLYSISFEEGKKYMIKLSCQGYEDQFFEFSTVQVPERDTLRVIMFESGTPNYYTRYGKRAFVPDSFAILIMQNKYGSEKDFSVLIEKLGLKVDSTNRILYRKRSGEAFDLFDDSVLCEIRMQSKLIEFAGANLGTINRINILGNWIAIIWNQKPSEMSVEEFSHFEQFLKENQLKGTTFEYLDDPNGIGKENQLKGTTFEFLEASKGIGLGINSIVEKLNKMKGVRLAYPVSFQPISKLK